MAWSLKGVDLPGPTASFTDGVAQAFDTAGPLTDSGGIPIGGAGSTRVEKTGLDNSNSEGRGEA